MNTPRKRRVWPYVLGGMVGLCLLPVILVASHIGLSRDAKTLRDGMKAASGSEWTTRVQFRSGVFLIPTARAGLALFNGPSEARDALAAIRAASVGVYERSPGGGAAVNFESTLAKMDSRMSRAGWERTIAVTDGRENVVVYSNVRGTRADAVSICVAVLDGDQLVVASAEISPDRLVPLIEKHMPASPFPRKST